jgi:CheY-like chemotaxis protein
MSYRVLTVGIDPSHLMTRQALLSSRGYDTHVATPHEVEEKSYPGRFDLVILSVMLSQEEKHRVRSKLPAETKVVALTSLVMPDELLRIVAEALP